MASEVRNLVVGRFWDGPSKNNKSGYIDFGIFGRVQLSMVRSDRNNAKDSSDWCVQMRTDRTLMGAITSIQKQIDEVIYEDIEDGTGKD